MSQFGPVWTSLDQFGPVITCSTDYMGQGLGSRVYLLHGEPGHGAGIPVHGTTWLCHPGYTCPGMTGPSMTGPSMTRPGMTRPGSKRGVRNSQKGPEVNLEQTIWLLAYS